MFEPCIRAGLFDGSTDPVVLADGGAVTACQTCLRLMGLDKLISRINVASKTVSLGQPARATPGMRRRRCQEIQLKSLILAQPERWRRG